MRSSLREGTSSKSQKEGSQKITPRTATRKLRKIEEFHKKAEGSKNKAKSVTTKIL